MAIPNEFATVQKINLQRPDLLQQNTHASCGEFTERVVLELSAKDARWGHVGKVPGQTQCPCSQGEGNAGRGHAVDAIMWKDEPSKVVDIIAGAHNPPNQGFPAWGEAPSGGQPWKPAMPVGSGSGGGGTQPPTDPALEQRVAALESKVTALEGQVFALQNDMLQYGSKIALRMSEGQVLCAVSGGPSEPDEQVRFESRNGVGAWETFVVEEGQ